MSEGAEVVEGGSEPKCGEGVCRSGGMGGGGGAEMFSNVIVS